MITDDYNRIIDDYNGIIIDEYYNGARTTYLYKPPHNTLISKIVKN